VSDTPMSMVEVVARAIYNKRNGAGAVPWSRREASHKEPYRSDARAAIEAMKVPSAEMVEAGQNLCERQTYSPPDMAFIFRHMIDAALAEKE